MKQRSLEGLVITDGATYLTTLGAWNALVADIAALTVGVFAESSLLHIEAEVAGTPASPLAQSNHEFIVYYHQVTDPTINRTYRIACADLSDATFFQGISEILDPAHADVAAFITTFEAFALIDGLATEVDQIVYEDD
jgi:hypothetical protein